MMRVCRILSVLCCAGMAAQAVFAAPAWEPGLRAELTRMAEHLTATVTPWPVPERVFRVEDYGAVADGATLNTTAIQKAIDACTAAGGGRVLCAGGGYLTATLELKDGVMLEIAKGSRLLASTRLADYPSMPERRPTIMTAHYQMSRSLIYAQGRERVGLRGPGLIDGRGSHENFPGEQTNGSLAERPFVIRMTDCRKVAIDGVALRDAASWMQNYVNCEDLILQGLDVENHSNWNNDGIDIDSCRNVIVRDCFLNSEDDGLCFKGAGLRTMENVLVENCVFYSGCNALKFGTDSQGGFRNVLVRHVEVGGTPPELRAHTRRPAHSGVAWETVDGGGVENILCTDIRVVRADAAIFLRRGDRGRVMPGVAHPAPGKLRRVVFDRVTGGEIGSLGACIIAGVPGAPVEDVVIRDVDLPVAGGGKVPKALPERAGNYPNPAMFGDFTPAYGVWTRHARGVALFNIRVRPGLPDARPLHCVDIGVEEISLDGKPIPACPPES